MKVYTSKSNARRALKAYGEAALAAADQLIAEVDGAWTLDNEAAEAIQEGQNPTSDIAPIGEEFGPKLEEAPAPKAKKQERLEDIPPVRHHSTIERPTKTVWHIADEMLAVAEANGEPAPRRKDVITECVYRGIAYYTARTQYQQWLSSRNGTFLK